MAEVSTTNVTPQKYEVKLIPNFNDMTFDAVVKVHLNITEEVKMFSLTLGDEIQVNKVMFWEASYLSRGHPYTIGSSCEFEHVNGRLQVTPSHPISPESIKEEGYLEFRYNGTIGPEDEKKGLFQINAVDSETNLKNGNAKYLLPILEDVPVEVILSVISPYRAGVETELIAGEHQSAGDGLFANNFNSDGKKIKISDLHFKINAPTVLILD